MSIWDAPQEPEEVDLWGGTERQIVGDDVVAELGLTTEVYSGAYKSGTMKTHYLIRTANGGRGSFFLKKHNVESNLRYYKGRPDSDVMILKGTITWEIVKE